MTSKQNGSSGAKAPNKPAGRRSKGEKTRIKILTAALEVIASSGLRNVTHRAVANQAGVQLSLTTYYFRDINELVQQAFERFCQNSQPRYQEVWAPVVEYLDGFGALELRKTGVRKEICAQLSQVATDYLIGQVTEKPVGLAVEQTFFTAARLSPELRALSADHRRYLLQPIEAMCRRFNKRDPNIDAELIFDTLSRLEYQALQTDPQEIDQAGILSLVQRQIGWALGLQRE